MDKHYSKRETVSVTKANGEADPEVDYRDGYTPSTCWNAFMMREKQWEQL